MKKTGPNRKRNRYVGKLSPAMIAQGMNFARENAQRLFQDAQMLLEKERYPSAIALAILAVEESAKVSILRELSVAKDQEEIGRIWRDYRSHTEKNRMLLFPNHFFKGARKLEDFRPIMEGMDEPELTENLKQMSIYTDCLGKAAWSCPSDVINEKLTRLIVQSAKLLTNKHEVVTEREIEVWIKHISPVWKQDMRLMKEALKNYFVEMHSLGLMTSSLEDAIAFIGLDKEWIH